MKRLTKLKLLASFCIIAYISCGCSSSKSLNSDQIVPYGFSWGSSYQTVSETHHGISPVTANENGDLLSSGTLDNKYLDIKDGVNLEAHYNFGKDDSLESLLVLLFVDEESTIQDSEVYDYLLDHYSNIMNETPQKGLISYELDDDVYNVDICNIIKHAFIISIGPSDS